MKTKIKQGFTLVEMIIVIAIIGILMTIAFTGLRNVQRAARDTRRIADLRKVQTYLELYYNQTGTYPNTTTFANMETLLTGQNISDIPHEPVAGRAQYSYYACNNATDYVLGADTEMDKVNLDVTTAPTGCSMTCSGSGALYCVKN